MLSEEEKSKEKVTDSFHVEVVKTPEGQELVRITRDGKTTTRLEHTVPSWMLSEE